MVDFTRGVPLAVATGSFWPVPTLDCISLLQSANIKDIELTLQMNECSLGFHHELRMPIEQQLTELQQAGQLRILSVHAAHLITEHGFSTRARSDFLAHMLRLTHRLKADLLVIHPSHIFINFEDSQNYLSNSGIPIWGVLLPQMAELMNLADSLGVQISMENVMEWDDDAGFYFNSPENLARFIKDIQHPSFSITLDLLHSAMVGNLNSCLDQVSYSISNLHLADWQPPYSRVIPTQGLLDWLSLLPRLKNLPALRHAAIELTAADLEKIKWAVHFLSFQ